MSDDQSLIAIDEDSALDYFRDKAKFEPILAIARAAIDGFKSPGVATLKDRKAIGAFAFKVAKSRTYIEAIGKEIAAEAKELPKKIDATRKYVRDTLQEWEDEVRKPLTDWEVAEDARVQKHRAAIERIIFLGGQMPGSTVTAFENTLGTVRDMIIDPRWEEFEDEAKREHTEAIRKLEEGLAAARKQEADAAELAALRAATAAREAKDREEQLIRDAEARAREKAAQEASEAAAKAEANAQAERDAAARREKELQDAKELAERRAQDAEKEAKRKIEEEAAREAEETRRREKDRAHKTTVNKAALAAFVAGGIPCDLAKEVIGLIAKKQIPAVSISY